MIRAALPPRCSAAVVEPGDGRYPRDLSDLHRRWTIKPFSNSPQQTKIGCYRHMTGHTSLVVSADMYPGIDALT